MISFIIISYKDKEYLIRLIKSIGNVMGGGTEYEVILVDSAKDIQLKELIEGNDLGIRYYALDDNRGYGFAAGYGVSKAKWEYICVMNADIEFITGNVKDICDRLERQKEVGLIGPKIILPDGMVQLSWGLKPTPINELIIKMRDYLYKKGMIRRIMERQTKHEFYAEWLTGACFFMRKEVWEEVEGFDTNFFLYFEDIDLSMRLLNRGYKILYYPSFQVLHYMGISKKQIITKADIEAKRSQLYFYTKHNSRVQLIILIAYLLIKSYIRLFYYKLMENEERVAVIKGIIEAIKNVRI